MTVHVFVDESHRRAHLLAAALVLPAALTPTRRLMRSLREPGQRRLHFKMESDQRRRTILAQLADYPVRVRIYSSRAEERQARALCLRQLVCDLVPDDARRLVIESREGRDQADRHVVYTALQSGGAPPSLTYEHVRPHEEPLLWIADAIAWAYGAGTDWRRRIDKLIEKIVDVG